ncbi:serine/arginine repetitive matrix protein 1-like [Rhipicephalus sanguineus]|uniref:serine/arginine repetitive matrix protein 1-like n=1 Tax=Rhipicephalus sanguineus TaxID=34632 RepID=UPI001892DEA8|nr:serine/arginine repetitive matrix protein 1-like [Rhipicephalus sanguineus]
MKPSTDEPPRKNDSPSKKETSKAGTEDIEADKTEDTNDDADDCPLTEQFFRSDVDDLLGTPNETEPPEKASFSEDFDTVDSPRGDSVIPVDIDDIIQETNVTLSRIDTEEKRRLLGSGKSGRTARSARNSQRLASTSRTPKQKKTGGSSVTSPMSPVGRQQPQAANRTPAKNNEASGKASSHTSPAPVATSTAVTRGPRPSAKPVPASSGRIPAADANLREHTSRNNSFNPSPALSPRSLAPDQRPAHQPAQFQGPFSDDFSPDTTQSPPSLASVMSPTTNRLGPQASHTDLHRTGHVAQSTRQRSSAAASRHRRDSNGRRLSLRRQSRDGDESFSTTESGGSDDLYADSRHRGRSRSSHYRRRRRRSKDRASRRRHSRDRRGSAHNARDPSVGPFYIHPYWNAPCTQDPAYYVGYLQAPGYPQVSANPAAPVYPQAPAYSQGAPQASASSRPAAFQGPPSSFAPAPVQSPVYGRPPEYPKPRGCADVSAPLPPPGYAPIPVFQRYSSGRVSFAAGAAPISSWYTNTQRRMPAPVAAPPRPRDWRQWQPGLFKPSLPRYSPPPPTFPPPPVFSATSYGSWPGAGSEDDTCRCRECCGECCKQAAAVRREQRRMEFMMYRSPAPPLWPRPFSRAPPFGGGGVLPARSTPWLWPTADTAAAAAEPYWPSVAPTRQFIWSTRRLPRHVWSTGGSFLSRSRSCPPPGYEYTEDTLQPGSTGSLPTSDTPSPIVRAHLQWGESAETRNLSVPGESEPPSPESPTSPQSGLPQKSSSASSIANAQNTVSFVVTPTSAPEQDTEHQSIICELITSISSCCGETEEAPATAEPSPGGMQRSKSISPEDLEEAYEQSRRAGMPGKKSVVAEMSVLLGSSEGQSTDTSSRASRPMSTSLTSPASSASSPSALGSSSSTPRSTHSVPQRIFSDDLFRPVSMDEVQAVVASDASAMYGWYQPLHIVSQASESGSQQPLVPVVLAPAEQELLSGAGGAMAEGLGADFFDFSWDAPEEGWRRSYILARPDRASSAGSSADAGRFSWSSDEMRRADGAASGHGWGSSRDQGVSETVYERPTTVV